MQSNDFELEQLKQKLSSVRRSAWQPIVQEGDGGLTASKFAGKPWLGANEQWPICPNCNKPMQLFLQLNLDELPESLVGKFGTGLLQFFYCTSIERHCESNCNGWEPFAEIKCLRIVQPSNRPAEVEIPQIENLFPAKLIIGWEEIDDYPSWYECDIILDDEESEILSYHGIPEQADKLAGWPSWVQDVEYPNCPTCSKQMNQFIFQIESEDNLPYMWGDAGAGYLLQCPEHKDKLAFLWQCS
jgi:uncharacterized protein YwqG